MTAHMPDSAPGKTGKTGETPEPEYIAGCRVVIPPRMVESPGIQRDGTSRAFRYEQVVVEVPDAGD